MLSLNNENINYVMTQILKLSCVSFSSVSIRYVLAYFQRTKNMNINKICVFKVNVFSDGPLK
jgi:hypothetical protein